MQWLLLIQSAKKKIKMEIEIFVLFCLLSFFEGVTIGYIVKKLNKKESSNT